MRQTLLMSAGESFAAQQKAVQQALLNITEAKLLYFLLEIREKYEIETPKYIGVHQQHAKE